MWRGEASHHSHRSSRAQPTLLKDTRTRVTIVMAVFALCYVVIALRVLGVTVFGSEESRNVYARANGNQDKQIFHRADIVDRNGILLAINLATASLYANPQVVLDIDEAAEKLRSVFPDMNKQALFRSLSSDKKFVWIKRNLTPVEQHAVNSLGIPGLYFIREEKRVYPHKNLLSHVLGYANIDGYGIAGVEKYADQYLREGWKDSGEPLQLSVDVRVQQVLHKVLEGALAQYKAKGTSGLVMDVSNGEVLGIASLPDFDPHNPGISDDNSLFNRATLGVYEMGSTFKTFNMAFGLESGNISMKDMYDVSEPLKIANFTIKDFHAKKPVLSFPEVYIYSSNIGSAKIALKAGEEKQQGFVRKLGLLSDMELEVMEKGSPLYPDSWGKSHTMTISYGHGIAVTPVHVAQATASLINGGKFYPATLMKGKNDTFTPAQVVNKKTSNNIRKLMRFAVEYGTGGNAEAKGYLVGGKTGSADKAGKGGYTQGGIVASFVGAFPMNKPRYVVFVMVDEPQDDYTTYGNATGGKVAAPLVKDIISRIGPILGVQPVNESDYEIRKEFWYDYDRAEPKMAALRSY
jgi:cell division protein FtsI (penicillin-binding protein 3)